MLILVDYPASSMKMACHNKEHGVSASFYSLHIVLEGLGVARMAVKAIRACRPAAHHLPFERTTYFEARHRTRFRRQPLVDHHQMRSRCRARPDAR